MAIKNYNKISAFDIGVSNNVTCPACKETVSMRLFNTKDTTLVAKIKGEDKNIYISVCPNCASVFSVNTNYLNERERGTYVLLTESDLRLIQNNNG